MVYTNGFWPFGSFELEPVFHKFNRAFQEVRGWTYRISEDGSSAVVYINALAVSPEDIEVSYKNGRDRDSVEFTVKGETQVDDLKAFNVEFSFISPIPVKTLKKRFENGLVILELGFSKPTAPDIELLD